MNHDKYIDTIRTMPMSGVFEITRINAVTREIIDVETDHNIIVNDSKEAIITSISTVLTDGVIQRMKVGEDVGGNVTMTGTPNLNFADANPDTIVRTTGSWITDGFIDDMSITITSSVSNNSTFVIDTVTATTITLVIADVLVIETGTGGVSVVGAASLDNPRLPLASYNSSTMSIIYAPATALTIGYSSATSVTFSLSIVGSAVMALFPTETTKTITSAALHTGDGKVFAYKRYPQKSVSALIDILINWTIKFD